MTCLPEKDFRLDQLMPLFREALDAGKTVRFSPRGVSMKPMLRQGRDSVILSPLPDKLQRYDLPLYRRPDGKYILHRVIAVEGDHYVCCGDNQYEPEAPVYPEQMIALVTAFTRGRRLIPVSAPGYRLYCRLWCAARPLLRLYKRGRALLGRLKRRLFA